MPKITEKLGLIQPEGHEKYDVEVQNRNMATLETALEEMKENNNNNIELSAGQALEAAKQYTDAKVGNLVGTAPEALNTIEELAAAMEENSDLIETLNQVMNNSAKKSELEEHENDTNIHVTTEEKSLWNDSNNKKHGHDNKSILDAIKQSLIDAWNDAANHITDGIRHITSTERKLWNTVSEKADADSIPTKISQLENDSNYLNAIPDEYVTDTEMKTYAQPKGAYLTGETDPTVPEWAKAKEKPSYTAEEVGADVAGSASTALATAKAYVDQAISDLVNGAPETLNTLKEISDALSESEEAVAAINTAIGNKQDKTGDSLNNTVTFTQATTRANIVSGEKHSVLFGKIAKWFADLKTVAFSGKYSDLSGVPTNVSQFTNDAKYIIADNVVEGDNVTIVLDSTNNKVTIAAKNTWRGIQNNLTSTSTTDSLSANQGRILEANKLANAIALTNEDLDDVKSPALYYGGGGNTVTNKPSGVEHFGLFVYKIAAGYIAQELTDETVVYYRYWNSSTWSGWVQRKFTDSNTEYTHPSYTAREGVPTANQTPAFGGTFFVSQPVSDGTGHISAMNSRTVTIPKTEATTSAAGLMSAKDKAKSDATNVAYGTCATAAATAAKVITISGNANWKLAAGSIIAVKFSYTNTAANPTFNVNGTGAKSVWYNVALITTSGLGYAGYASRTAFYMYDGTQYVFLGWSIDSNTTYSNASLGQGYGTCATAEATTAKVVTLSSYALVTGGFVAVKFTYAVPASATMNINSKGAKAVYYRGAAITAGVIKAGDIATFVYNGSQYHLVAIDRVNGENTVDNLSSTSAILPLSANQGRVLNEKIEAVETAFQDGCDTIVAGCTTYGSTPTSNSPANIVEAIKAIFTNRYNSGVSATKVGTATAEHVLTGKTFTNASGVGLSGTMENKGAWTATPTGSGNVAIPAGYHDGSGYVNTATVWNNAVAAADNRVATASASYKQGVADTKVGTAAAAQVLSGYTFTNASGVGLSGSMANSGGSYRAATTITNDSANSRVVAKIPLAAYYNTNGALTLAWSTLASIIGLTAAKILSGNTILGIAGTATANKSIHKIGDISYSGTLLTSSRNWDFDYTSLPNYESLTANDFFFLGTVQMNSNGTTGKLGIVIKSTGTVRVNWWGDAQKSSCSVSASLYALA